MHFNIYCCIDVPLSFLRLPIKKGHFKFVYLPTLNIMLAGAKKCTVLCANKGQKKKKIYIYIIVQLHIK